MKKVAVPIENGRFSPHFGGADQFSIFEVDDRVRLVVNQTSATPPPHEKGAFPRFLEGLGVQVVLAGNMGPRAIQMLEHYGIEVWTGVQGVTPEGLVQDYLKGDLTATGEPCREGGFHDCGHDHHSR